MNPITWFKGISTLRQVVIAVLVAGALLKSALVAHAHAVANTVRNATIATEHRIDSIADARIAEFDSVNTVLRDSLNLRLGQTHTVFVNAKLHVDSNAIASAAVTAALEAVRQEQRAIPEVASLITTTQRLQQSDSTLRHDFEDVQRAYRADSLAWTNNLTARDVQISAVVVKLVTDSLAAQRALDAANRHRLTVKKGAVVAGTGYALVRALEWFVASRRH